MIKKDITYFGQASVLVCDGQCNKAWGMNSRPQLYFMEKGPCKPRLLREGEDPRDDDDYVYIADGELGEAPEQPGTSEGGDCKPFNGKLNQANAHLMNKWCARECERSVIVRKGEKIELPDLANPTPNVYARAR